MKNKNAKKAALLLTMIIGAQLLGSKELLATNKTVREQETGKRLDNSKSKAEKTKTWVELLKNAEGDLEGIIYRMMAKTLNGLTEDQIERAIIEMYLPEIRGITKKVDLKNKLENSLELHYDWYKFRREDLTEGVSRKKKEMIEMLHNEIYSMAALWSTSKSEVDEIISNITEMECEKLCAETTEGKNSDFKIIPEKLKERLNKKFMDKGSTEALYLEKMKSELRDFVDKVMSEATFKESNKVNMIIVGLQDAVDTINAIRNHKIRVLKDLFKVKTQKEEAIKKKYETEFKTLINELKRIIMKYDETKTSVQRDRIIKILKKINFLEFRPNGNDDVLVGVNLDNLENFNTLIVQGVQQKNNQFGY